MDGLRAYLARRDGISSAERTAGGEVATSPPSTARIRRRGLAPLEPTLGRTHLQDGLTTVRAPPRQIDRSEAVSANANEPAGVFDVRLQPAVFMSDWARTKRIPGVLIFAGGGSLEGDLHLQVSTRTNPTEEMPLEMLNRSDDFLPVTMPDEDVRLVSKNHVAAVSFDGDAPGPPPLPMSEPLRFEVQMSDGSEYRGEVLIELEPPSTRGLDFLNQPGRFFPLSVPGRTWYLNRMHVQNVRPHD